MSERVNVTVDDVVVDDDVPVDVMVSVAAGVDAN